MEVYLPAQYAGERFEVPRAVDVRAGFQLQEAQSSGARALPGLGKHSFRAPRDPGEQLRPRAIDGDQHVAAVERRHHHHVRTGGAFAVIGADPR